MTRKPLPYQHSAAKAAPGKAPKLVVRPTASLQSTNDIMCKLLYLPECLDTALMTELRNSGLFSSVELQTNAAPVEAYVLQTTLKDLRWEVPHYDRILGTTFAVSLFTGGIGGIIYGCTGTEVLGHSSLHFTVTDTRVAGTLLDRDYSGTTTLRKAKLSCDTAPTRREVAAGALKDVIDDLQADLQQLNLQ